MRTIQRRPTPACLAKQPKNQNWNSFIGTPCHEDVHYSLQQEQSGLCCYCEIEICVGDGHIDHMEPRRQNRKRIYDYNNLVLSCNGKDNKKVESSMHCGHFKDNRAQGQRHSWDGKRFLPPHNPMTVKLIRYLSNGRIEPTKKDPDKANYIINYLGLNCAGLTYQRQGHARDLIHTIGDPPDPNVRTWLRQVHLAPDENGRLKPFYSLSKEILGS